MRRPFTEYQYDWMLHSILDLALKIKAGTQKEYELLLKAMPYFKEPLQVLLDAGNPGLGLIDIFREHLANILSAKERGKKLCVNTFCFPPPILHAFDVTHICAEAFSVLGTLLYHRGVGDYVDYCTEVGYSETACAAQRSALGALLAGLSQTPDFVLCNTPGVCDTNAHAYAFLASYLDIPFYQLNYPPELTGDRSKAYHRTDFRHLIRFLEEQTGNPLNEEVLRNTIMEIDKQNRLVNDIMDLQRMIPCPVPSIAGLFIYAGKFIAGGLPSYTTLLEDILEQSVQNAELRRAGTPSGRERVRLMIMYLDHYNPKLEYWSWMNENDISSMGTVLDIFWSQGAPYAENREDETFTTDFSGLDQMIDSMADQASRMPMIKQIRGPYDAPNMWLDDLVSLARIYRPDCLVYAGSAGCRNTWGMVKLAARDLESMGYPTLILNSDGFDPRCQSWNLTAHRIEEFLKVRRLVK